MSCALTHHLEVKSDIYLTHFFSFQGGTAIAYTDITCDTNWAQDVGVTCLLVAAIKDVRLITWDDSRSGEYIIQYGLVLQFDETGVYRRTGMFEHDSRKGRFQDAEVATVEVI